MDPNLNSKSSVNDSDGLSFVSSVKSTKSNPSSTQPIESEMTSSITHTITQRKESSVDSSVISNHSGSSESKILIIESKVKDPVISVEFANDLPGITDHKSIKSSKSVNFTPDIIPTEDLLNEEDKKPLSFAALSLNSSEEVCGNSLSFESRASKIQPDTDSMATSSMYSRSTYSQKSTLSSLRGQVQGFKNTVPPLWCPLFLSIQEVSGLSPIYPAPTNYAPHASSVMIKLTYTATLLAKKNAARSNILTQWNLKVSSREAGRRVWEMNEVLSKAKELCSWVEGRSNLLDTEIAQDKKKKKAANNETNKKVYENKGMDALVNYMDTIDSKKYTLKAGALVSSSDGEDESSEEDSNDDDEREKERQYPILPSGYIHTLSREAVKANSVMRSVEPMGDSLYSENSMIQTHLQNSRIKKEKKVGALIALSGEEKRKGDDNVDARNRKMYEEMVGLGGSGVIDQALKLKLVEKMGKSETQFRSGLLGAVERRDADQEYFKKMSVLGHPSVSGYNSGIYVGNVNLYQPMESDMNRQSQYQNPNQVGYRQSQFQMDNRQSQYQMENRQSQYQNQGDYRQSQHNQMDNRKSQYNNANGMPKDENRQSTIAPRIKKSSNSTETSSSDNDEDDSQATTDSSPNSKKKPEKSSESSSQDDEDEDEYYNHTQNARQMGFYHARHSQVQIPSQPTKSSIQPISQNGVSKKKIKKRYASSEEEEEEREATKKEEKTNVEFNVESNMESHPTRLARYKNAVKEDSEHISQTKVSEVKKLSDPNIKLDDDLNVEKIRSSDEDKIEMSRVRARPKPALKPFQPRKSGNQTKKKVILVSTSEDEEDNDDDDDE